MNVRTLRRRWIARWSRTRLLATLATGFGLAALFLVAVGLYGVIAQWAAQRTREIGVRMALGATSGGVRWLVLRQGVVLVLVGLVLGIPAALAAVAVAAGSAVRRAAHASQDGDHRGAGHVRGGGAGRVPARAAGLARGSDGGAAMWSEPMLRDLRLAIRTLWRQAAFTALAVAILALGLGSSIATFGLVEALVTRVLPYPETDRLVQLFATAGNQRSITHAPVALRDYQARRSPSRAWVGCGGRTRCWRSPASRPSRCGGCR
jgi:hypothetical protein